MAEEPPRESIVRALLKRYPRTFAREAGIDLEDKPSPLFMLLVTSLLFSTRISHDIAMQAAKAIFSEGWTTPDKMAATSREDRVILLDDAKYTRYDEGTATRLADAAGKVLSDYQGDLRNLRQKANRRPAEERALLKEFRGIGDVGADIFLREVQVIWNELFPFADNKALEPARKLGLPDSSEGLKELVEADRFAVLVDALVWTSLNNDYEAILEEAQRVPGQTR